SRIVKGDLDWIAMKAIEKDRSRRYETASALARDIERYLNDEPVEAGPPSAYYRLKKLAWKHRGPLVALLACAALLLFGIAASTWQAIRATRAETKARQSADQALASASAEKTARQQAQAAAEAERLAKESAQERETETKAVLD